MARRWTPQRLIILRRVRVAICVVALVLTSAMTFVFTARKTVALTVNGSTRTVQTYAMSVQRLLQEQHVDLKTHDFVDSTSGNSLNDHAVVTVRSAYQTTITINGKQVPFWTVATSANQLIGFFKENDQQAAKITVDIGNVYNQLTGGLVINKDGPVTVIADGKTSIAPNGRLTAASILDSKGITLGKDDRVGVEEDGGTTILRVRRVTHGQQTRMVSIPFGTQTITDSSLQPGQTVIRQQGTTGQRREVYDVTYVDGTAESETLVSKTTTRLSLDNIIAVGPAKATDSSSPSVGTGSGASGQQDKKSPQGSSSGSPSSSPSGSSSSSSSSTAGQSQSESSGSSAPTEATPSTPTHTQTAAPTPTSTPTPTPAPAPAPAQTQSTYWHASVADAQTYAAGAAAQYGWTGQNWTDLVSLWNRESSWSWSAENSSSGAYGIPQSFPGNKMAQFGSDWRDNAATQIQWGLSYIKQTYGSPSAAWANSNRYGWY